MKIIIALSTLLVSVLFSQKTDKETGLIIDKGYKFVKQECTLCHSANFIINQRGNRQTWKDMIVWMQEDQGLRQFKPAEEKLILDYLAKNYAPEKGSRRKSLLAP